MDTLGTGFDALLARAALCVLGASACWALVIVVAVALEAWTGGRLHVAERAGCPRRLRLWLLPLCVAVLAGAAPAYAGDTGSGSPGRGSADAVAGALDGLALPDRTHDTGVHPHPTTRVAVVRPGDSLWRIVRAVLPPTTPDSAIAAGVAAVHAANLRTIGPDPDLLRPGQHLDLGPLLDFPTRTTLSEAP